MPVVPVQLTTGVPESVIPVTVPVLKIVALTPVNVMLPVVPKANVRVLLLLELNKPVDNVRLFRFNAPLVSVVVRVAPTVMLS